MVSIEQLNLLSSTSRCFTSSYCLVVSSVLPLIFWVNIHDFASLVIFYSWFNVWSYILSRLGRTFLPSCPLPPLVSSVPLLLSPPLLVCLYGFSDSSILLFIFKGGRFSECICEGFTRKRVKVQVLN